MEVIFKLTWAIDGWGLSRMDVSWPRWLLVNIGSGNGFVASGNKTLPEPMLTQNLVSQ